MSRKVEVYCWTEKLTQFTERRGDQVRKGTKCDYTPTWVEVDNMPDSANFRDKSKVNIPSSVKSKEFRAHGLRLGTYQIDTNQGYQAFNKVQYRDLYKTEKFIPPHDIHGTWKYYKDRAELRRKSAPGTDQIGDLRVTFECIKGDVIKASALGV